MSKNENALHHDGEVSTYAVWVVAGAHPHMQQVVAEYVTQEGELLYFYRGGKLVFATSSRVLISLTEQK